MIIPGEKDKPERAKYSIAKNKRAGVRKSGYGGERRESREERWERITVRRDRCEINEKPQLIVVLRILYH
jgi:hypothetical protein